MVKTLELLITYKQVYKVKKIVFLLFKDGHSYDLNTKLFVQSGY